MEKYKIKSLDELTPELLYALIQRFEINEVPRINRLFNWYNSKQDILNRTTNDPAKPNNRVVNPWARYITMMISNFVLGKPVSYSSINDELMEDVQDIFNANNEQSHNLQLGRSASICGISYELLYLDENGEIKFDPLNPAETFMIYDTSVRQKFLAAVRFYRLKQYDSDEQQLYVEVYTRDEIHYYTYGDEDLTLTETEQHYFGGVPVIPVFANPEHIGHFEPVMELINAYDITVSDKLNFNESISDAYLLLKGVTMEQEDVAKMKQNRVILVEGEQGDAKWLTKDADQDTEKLIRQLKEDIHQLSGVPNLTDSRFGGQESSSGVAMRYKIMSLENIGAEMERYMTHSLERRIKMICHFLNLKKAKSYDPTELKMKFTRNLVANTEAEAKIVTDLKGTVSDRTLLNQLSFIEDVSAEMELLKQQNEDALDAYDSIYQPTPEDIPEGN